MPLPVLLLALAVSPAYAATYLLPAPDEALIGHEQLASARYEETLLDIARRYNLGYEDIKLANPGVDTWIPGQNMPVLLPTRYVLPPGPREGIVINIAEMRLYYYPQEPVDGRRVVITHPVSIGRDDWKTPLGTTRIVRKDKDPAWYPPESIRREHAADGDPLPKVVPPGPDNPLGRYALRLGIPGYLIHGTDKPFGIGMQVTHGCMRMYPEDIEAMFRLVPVGTAVRIINQPVKTGWHRGTLYLEVHPPLGEAAAAGIGPALEKVAAALRERQDYVVDWPWLEGVVAEPRGIPLPVRQRGESAQPWLTGSRP
ncbi:MAG TPA: L,D-transpeptidase family protein [Nevskiales bacterium]|nr:L,D-transpeptidase family protein [Nevskiales bacterium]